MKKRLITLLAVLCICVSGCSRSEQSRLTAPAVTGQVLTEPETSMYVEDSQSVPAEGESAPEPSSEGLSDPLRPAYNQGNCRELSGNISVLCFYLDDETSCWDEGSISAYSQEYLHPAYEYLEDRAGDFGLELHFEFHYFSTDETLALCYPGTVVSDLYTSDISRDVLEQCAILIGYPDAREMDAGMREYFGTDQVIYLVLLNRDGTSYTMPDSIADEIREIEYCVLFPEYLGIPGSGTPATVSHETLHLFGAEDYYDPYGNYPNRKALCEAEIPDDIMLVTYYDVSDNTISDATAYTVGWLSEPPELMQREQWQN